MRDVIQVTSKLKGIVGNKKSKLVVNVGGWTTDKFVIAQDKPKLYDKVYDALKVVDLSEVELTIQICHHFHGIKVAKVSTTYAPMNKPFCQKTGIDMS